MMSTTTLRVVFVGLLGVPFLLIDPTLAANILFTLFTLSAWGFVVLYALRSNWRATRAGRTVMYLAGSFAAVGSQVAVSIWLGSDYPGRDFVRLSLYYGIALTMLNLTWTLWRYQNSPELDS